MSEVIIVGYQEYDFGRSLVVGEIVYKDLSLNLEEYDGLIFTSKNGILSLQASSEKYPHMAIYKSLPAFLIGSSSAKVLKKLGGNIAFISIKAHGHEFAIELEKILDKNKKYAYFRANKIVSGLDEKLLEKGFKIHSFCNYESKIRFLAKSLKPSKNSILLFTSPSAYYYFLENFGWDDSYRACALGKTTFGSFHKGINAKISNKQEIKEAYFSLKEGFVNGKN